jgi:hypothetical protein
MSDQQVRDAALRVLESRGQSLRPEQGDRIDSLVRTALSANNRDMDGAELARRLLISESSAYRSAFLQLMTSAHPVLTGEEAEAVRSMQRLEYRAMGEGSGPVGAYGLPVLIDPSILLTRRRSDCAEALFGTFWVVGSARTGTTMVPATEWWMPRSPTRMGLSPRLKWSATMTRTIELWTPESAPAPVALTPRPYATHGS